MCVCVCYVRRVWVTPRSQASSCSCKECTTCARHQKKKGKTPTHKDMLKNVYIVAAKRTAFGTFGGSLKDVSAVELGAYAAKAAVAQIGNAEIVDSVFFGNVAQTTTDCAYLARHAGLKAGVPIDKPMLTVNRLCGSGFQSLISGTQDICLGESEISLCGGSENMSLSPYLVHGVRFGTTLGQDPPMVDSLWDTLKDKYVGCPMAITAENLAEKFDVSKDDADNFALLSQQRWNEANEAGRFKSEITPVPIKHRKKGKIDFETDEHPRPQTTIEMLNKLKPLFKKDGTVTAGNASGISDGAGALIVASEDAVKTHNLKPIARVVSYGIAGVPPEIMGYGPVPAFNQALDRAGLSIDDMDLLEINEAFAPQFLACQKELNIDMDKINVNGGAIALGHPTGASGSRIMAHLAYVLVFNNFVQIMFLLSLSNSLLTKHCNLTNTQTFF